ncbi:MAG TPA: hypothetical protein DCO75_05580 [Fibrobacteres bacterium]|jgi:prepilin-type N-terminal cleavage/methylation domain-containing protein|nr:hypothetical protein [Fibrobacterota bacterium]
MKNKRIQKSGFTILEVVISILILGFVFTAVLNLMTTGDRINGRRVNLSNATMLASSQIEQIRRQEESLTILEDTTYEETINSSIYKVQRTRIKSDNAIINDSALYYHEYSVNILSKNDIPYIQLRLLQGISGKQ